MLWIGATVRLAVHCNISALNVVNGLLKREVTKFYVGRVVDKESLEERKKSKNNEK
ncbi:hypothetical protein CPT_Pollock80 [Escherichia phage Pollock]|uniref:Uncharacterized protein n=1 Tax=Escherichia phage Pollock TaxID=1540097 RepID=A0A0A0YPZ3_9CAUD|nr:hypothetical protein ACQ44_gp80 [Escherichia phage Pollock]AIX12439.1 hypothetical protein CPT_Pollock80 [Escherichia phage Pollock]